MIHGHLSPELAAAFPPEVVEALGLRIGDALCYEIDGDSVLVLSAARDTDDRASDADLDPIIDAALAGAGDTYSADEVFGELHARIDGRHGRRDAA